MSVRTLLIVDDDDSVLEFLETGFAAAGYQAVTAPTATQALGKLKAQPGGFPVVVSDIMMPGIDGLQLLHIVKQQYPETEVIMLTAHASLDSAIRSLKEGAFSYLKKPVDFEELKATVNNAFEKYVLSRQNRHLVEELASAREFSDAIVRELVYTVIATGPDGRIQKINKATERLLGYTDAELRGQPLQTVLGREFQQSDWVAMAGAGTVTNFAVVFRTKAGRELRCLFSGTIMKTAAGQPIGFLGTVAEAV